MINPGFRMQTNKTMTQKIKIAVGVILSLVCAGVAFANSALGVPTAKMIIVMPLIAGFAVVVLLLVARSSREEK